MKLTDDEMLVEISFVRMSKYRTKVLKTLEEDVKIPSQISRDVGIISNHISNTLNELKEHELVECVNPEVRKGRLYRLTEKGEKVSKKIDEPYF